MLSCSRSACEPDGRVVSPAVGREASFLCEWEERLGGLFSYDTEKVDLGVPGWVHRRSLRLSSSRASVVLPARVLTA